MLRARLRAEREAFVYARVRVCSICMRAYKRPAQPHIINRNRASAAAAMAWNYTTHTHTRSLHLMYSMRAAAEMGVWGGLSGGRSSALACTTYRMIWRHGMGGGGWMPTYGADESGCSSICVCACVFACVWRI